MSLTGLAFLAAFAAGLAYAFFVRPIYGLYTYVAVFYLHPPSRWWGGALPDIRWSLVAAAVTLIALFAHRAKLDKKSDVAISHRGIKQVFYFFFLYVFWMWVQLLFVDAPRHTEGVVLFSKYLLLCFLIYALLKDESDFRGFCIAHLIGCAFFGYLVWQAPDAGRLEGVGGPGVNDANSLGMHLGTGLFFGAFLLLTTKGYLRWIVLASIPLILNGIIQTETRGAVIGVVLGGIFTTFLKPKSVNRRYYALAMVALCGVIFLANETFIERVASVKAAVDTEREWDNSAMSRIEVAKAQLRMFSDNPLGVGHQGTAYLSREYLDARWLASNSGTRASHNTVMSVLVDQGLPGILIFLMILLSILSTLLKLKRMDRSGLPESFALYRTMLGGALVSIFGAGMFAQNLKAEVSSTSTSPSARSAADSCGS